MRELFPIRSSSDETDQREPELLELDDDRTDEVFDALGSETARQILLELHEGPQPASELAAAVDTTIQNVQYHLTKLEAADLVAVADTWYAENGAEMDVYAPTDEALVLFAGTEPKRSLRKLLKRLVTVLGPVALGATALALWFDGGGDPESAPSESDGGEFAGSDGGSSGADGGAGGDGGDGAPPDDADTATSTDGAGSSGDGLRPGTDEPDPTATSAPDGSPTDSNGTATPTEGSADGANATTEDTTAIGDAADALPESTDVVTEFAGAVTESAGAAADAAGAVGAGAAADAAGTVGAGAAAVAVAFSVGVVAVTAVALARGA